MKPEDFLVKNIEMWERFTSTYMDNMFAMVEKTMEQSGVFKQRIDKAVSEAVASQLEATLAGLQSLQKQVQALSDQIDRLVDTE